MCKTIDRIVQRILEDNLEYVSFETTFHGIQFDFYFYYRDEIRVNMRLPNIFQHSMTVEKIYPYTKVFETRPIKFFYVKDKQFFDFYTNEKIT